MTAVDMKDALVYGFKLLGYLLLVFIAGGILLVIGSELAPRGFGGGGSIILALLFWVAGVSVIYAGSLGMLYKVIGDGVEVGNNASRQPSPAPAQTPQSPGRGGGAAPQTGQGRQRR